MYSIIWFYGPPEPFIKISARHQLDQNSLSYGQFKLLFYLSQNASASDKAEKLKKITSDMTEDDIDEDG